MSPAVSLTTMIPLSRLWDVWVSAIEGGINYWGRIYGARTPDAGASRRAAEAIGGDALLHFAASTPTWAAYYFAPFVDGGCVFIMDTEEPDSRPLRIDGAALVRALATMMSEPKLARHFSDIITENDDATTADVLVQLAAFGEVRYG